MNKRGFFGIGVYHPKKEVNIGTLWRSACILGADFMFTIGKRYIHQGSDTVKAYRHVPLWEFASFGDFIKSSPRECALVCVELADSSLNLADFRHPERAVYLLGAEDGGIPMKILNGNPILQIPSEREYCLNVSVAGSIVMYDRLAKRLVQPG